MPRTSIRLSRLSLPLALAFATSGCATVFTGTADPITFESEPAGALVVIDGVDRGRTPLTMWVNRDVGGAYVSYRLEGYETRSFQLGREFNVASIWGIFCFPLCPLVDVLTGAVMRYDPLAYSQQLFPRDPDQLTEAASPDESWDGIRPGVVLVDSAPGRVVTVR